MARSWPGPPPLQFGPTQLAHPSPPLLRPLQRALQRTLRAPCQATPGRLLGVPTEARMTWSTARARIVAMRSVSRSQILAVMEARGQADAMSDAAALNTETPWHANSLFSFARNLPGHIQELPSPVRDVVKHKHAGRIGD